MPERESNDSPPPNVAFKNEWSSVSTWRTQEHRCFYRHRPGFVLCILYRTEWSIALCFQYFEMYGIQTAFTKWELCRIVDCPYNHGQYNLIMSAVRRAMKITVGTLCTESIGFLLFSVLPPPAISDWPFARFVNLRVQVPYTVCPASLSFHENLMWATENYVILLSIAERWLIVNVCKLTCLITYLLTY